MRLSYTSVLAIGIIAWSATAEVALATPASSQAVSLGFTLSSNKISAGEPVIATYRITNHTSGDVQIYTAQSSEKWLTIKLTDSEGHPLQPATEKASRIKALRPDTPIISPGSSYDGYVSLNKRFNITSAGQYCVSFVTNLSYTVGSDTSPHTLSQTFNLPLMVIPQDDGQMVADAKILEENVLGNKNVAERQESTEALLSMPEKNAASTWRELVDDPGLEQSSALEIAEQLTRLGTETAANLIARMAWDTPQRWPDGGVDATQYLQEMYHDGDAVLRHHIETLFHDYGKQMPARLIGSVN